LQKNLDKSNQNKAGIKPHADTAKHRKMQGQKKGDNTCLLVSIHNALVHVFQTIPLECRKKLPFNFIKKYLTPKAFLAAIVLGHKTLLKELEAKGVKKLDPMLCGSDKTGYTPGDSNG
jgi:hypothetical protein